MKKIGICVLALLFMVGCSTMGNKQITNDDIVSQIKIGISTKSDVKQKVGEPSKVTFTDNGEEVWDYVYIRGQMRPATVVPIVGLFAGGSDTKMQSLTIRFNKEGKVSAVGRGKMSGGGGSVLD